VYPGARDNGYVRSRFTRSQSRLLGSAVGVVAAAVLGLAMLPARAHMSGATSALVLVLPVLAAVLVGGLFSGVVSVAAGFLVYDFMFVRPYGTLAVGQAQDWVALGVYAVVMLLAARIVTTLDDARASSEAREASARHLLELSELLLADKSAVELGSAVADWAQGTLGLGGVGVLLPVDNKLELVASAGSPASPEELRRLTAAAGLPVPLSTGTSHDVVQTLALASSGRPVGILVLRDVPPQPAVREVLPILANHLAMAIERAQLRERVMHAEVLEQVDRLRRSLIGAVSHDLRTPLATIKVASSSFLEQGSTLSREDADELHSLIDMQADRLTMLVNSLLDMTRIESGALEVRRRPCSLDELVDEAVTSLRSSLVDRKVEAAFDEPPPVVDVDPLLIVQVLANLLDNANRFGPEGTPITVSAEQALGRKVVVAVSDHGIGVPVPEREAVFEKFVRFDTGGRSGLGLAIAKAFVEAHGDRIWVDEAPGGGARFSFTLPGVHGR